MSASSNLPKEIEQALNHSKWLIVVCSPRAVLSPWVNREIAYFRGLGRDQQILALLIEGEPASSFPAAPWSPSRTYAAGVATRLTHRDLNLLQKRLGARIDACSATAGPPGPKPEIFAIITCHDTTIGLGKGRQRASEHRSHQIASTRSIANKKAGTVIDTHCSATA